MLLGMLRSLIPMGGDSSWRVARCAWRLFTSMGQLASVVLVSVSITTVAKPYSHDKPKSHSHETTDPRMHDRVAE
jgi:hypothetical protein